MILVYTMTNAQTTPSDRVRFPDVVAVRVPRTMRDSLARIAVAEDRSVAYIIRRLLGDALEIAPSRSVRHDDAPPTTR